MSWPISDSALFWTGSAAIVWISRKPLRQPGSHGFYRFFAWEAMLVLFLVNREPWGADPWSLHQLMAWPLLAASVLLVALGLIGLRRAGRPGSTRGGGSFYAWEQTTALVTTGIFAHIRHPMYASLLALTWGEYLQAPGWTAAVVATTASMFLLLTALADERECLAYFGAPYAEYMRRTRRFIPGLI